MTYLAGKVALDITAGAPNNGRGEDNTGVVKKLRIGREAYPYVSAQAFRRWVRDSLPAAEPRSPVTREGQGKKQQAYTDGRPDLYLDDDLFGYMVAIKGENFQRDTVLGDRHAGRGRTAPPGTGLRDDEPRLPGRRAPGDP